MVLGKLPVSGLLTIWISIGQGPTALAVGAGGVCLDIFTLICPFSPLSPSLWETARYRLKYCLEGPLNPKQPTNQPTIVIDGDRSEQRTGLAVSQVFGGTQFSKMNVDLPMDGQPVWLVSGVCSTGSGQTISKEHFRAFESIFGKA